MSIVTRHFDASIQLWVEHTWPPHAFKFPKAMMDPEFYCAFCGASHSAHLADPETLKLMVRRSQGHDLTEQVR